jgi:hypothetical protein
MVQLGHWAGAMATALALMSATPALAQAPGFGVYFGSSQENDWKRYPQLPMCLTDHQIREAIARRGFDNISLNVPDERRVQVRASRDGAVYLIDFDFCADRIRGAQQIR